MALHYVHLGVQHSLAETEFPVLFSFTQSLELSLILSGTAVESVLARFVFDTAYIHTLYDKLNKVKPCKLKPLCPSPCEHMQCLLASDVLLQDA